MAFIGQSTSIATTPDLVLDAVPCDPTVIVTDWVIMQNGIAVKGSAQDLLSSNIIGLCESKLSSVSIRVRVLGVSQPIFTGLDESKEYNLQVDAGTMGTTAPTDSGQVVLKLGQPYNSTQFLVLKGNRILRS